MGRRRAVGFYTRGRGRRRKVIPITGRSRYAYRGIPPRESTPKPELEKKSIGDLEARIISRAKELQKENPNWSAHGCLQEAIAEEAEWAPKEKQEKLLELMEKYELYRAEGKIDGFGELGKNPTNPKTHQHWMATDNKWWENIEHPINQPHLDIKSKERHDIETGKFKRWVKRRGLKFTDATYELYEQKIKAELEAQKGEKDKGLEERPEGPKDPRNSDRYEIIRSVLGNDVVLDKLTKKKYLITYTKTGKVNWVLLREGRR